MRWFVPERQPTSLAESFHENTKVRPFDSSWSDEFFSPTMTNIYRLVKDPYKTYPRYPSIPLSKPWEVGAVARTLRRRRSIRDFTGQPISRRCLSRVLALACGITGEHVIGGPDVMALRANASGGGLYPIEIYPVVLSATDMTPGVYHYAPKAHALEQISTGDYRSRLQEIVLGQPLIKTASVVFVMTSVTVRHMFKYGDRGYRYMLFDAGHISQNLYLVSTALGLGGCAIGGFVDDRLNEVVEVDGVEEMALYVFVLGKPRPRYPEWVERLVPRTFWVREE